MADDELTRLERERQDADRRYNDALTALDAALVSTTPTPRLPIGAAPQIPEAPNGWRGWWLRPVRRWLAPWLEAQRQFNASAAAAIADIASREQQRADAFERFQSALIVFLQHITAFVESKDRALASMFGNWFVYRLDGGLGNACVGVPSYDTLRLLAVVGAGTPLFAVSTMIVEHFQHKSKRR